MNDSSRPGSVGIAQTFARELSGPLRLDCGAVLEPVTIAYETYGRSRRRATTSSWSATRSAATPTPPVGATRPRALRARSTASAAEERGIEARGGLGWWDGMIGPGKAFDTDRYFVVCTNLLGSCRGSTGPAVDRPGDRHSRTVSTFRSSPSRDMVRAERALPATCSGIDPLLAVAGGSLGGMQALEWALPIPAGCSRRRLDRQHARLGSQGMAWNAIARNAIMADPDWQGGHYYGTGRAPTAGMGVARMVGHVTYLSAESMRREVRPAPAGRETTIRSRSPSPISRSRAICAIRPRPSPSASTPTATCTSRAR